MTGAPVVSVVIPTYNRASLVGRAVGSVLGQTFPDLEVVVVDDGSTDGTEEAVRAVGDGRVRYLRHEANRGVAAARNTGMAHARGEYVAFLDSDDVWLPEWVEAHLAAFQASSLPRVGAVASGMVVAYRDREETVLPTHRGGIYLPLLTMRWEPLQLGCFCFRRDAFPPDLRFDEALRVAEDRDFLLRFSRGASVERVSRPLMVHHCTSPARLTRPLERRHAELVLRSKLEFIHKHGESLRDHPAALAQRYRDVSSVYYMLGDIRSVRAMLCRAIRVYPWDPAVYLRLVASLGGAAGLRAAESVKRAVHGAAATLRPAGRRRDVASAAQPPRGRT